MKAKSKLILTLLLSLFLINTTEAKAPNEIKVDLTAYVNTGLNSPEGTWVSVVDENNCLVFGELVKRSGKVKIAIRKAGKYRIRFAKKGYVKKQLIMTIENPRIRRKMSYAFEVVMFETGNPVLVKTYQTVGKLRYSSRTKKIVSDHIFYYQAAKKLKEQKRAYALR